MAIDRWRVPLLGIVMKLCAEIGFTEGANVERLSKPLYRFVLNQLRKAESAARRLIFAAARNIVLEPPAQRSPRPRSKVSPEGKAKAGAEIKAESKGKAKRRPSFGLFDPLKRQGRRFKKKRRGPEPHVYSLESFLQQRPATSAPAPVERDAVDDGMVSAKHLVRRLIAVLDALKDIPRQARRLALWQARPKEERRPERWSPLRPGRPPGFRQRSIHEVDDILKECDWLARNGHPPLDDTS